MSVVALAQTSAPTGEVPAAAAVPAAPPDGHALFADSGCAHCHGDTGLGTPRGPSLREVRRKMTATQISAQIREGKGSMPAFVDVLDAAQIEALVTFLRDKRAWTRAAPH